MPRNVDHLRPYQWQKGQSGNPKGRQKGKTLTDLLHEELRKLEFDGRPRIEHLAEKVVELALKKKLPWFQELADRIDPKPRRLEHSGPGGGAIPIEERRAGLEEKLGEMRKLLAEHKKRGSRRKGTRARRKPKR